MFIRIMGIIYAICYSVPLVFALLYLIKIVIRRNQPKDTLAKLSMKIFLVTLLTFGGVVVLITIIIIFVFPQSIDIPVFWKALVMLISLFYICTVGGLVVGLGQMGHAGVSPRKMLNQIFFETTKSGKKKNGGEPKK
jgi:Na+/H+ antiporter NhaD/arsenite permease-like protein